MFLQDITEEKKQANALWESQSRYISLYEHSSAGIVIIDLEGRIIQANQAFQDLIGYSESELMGMYYFDLTHPDDQEAARHRYQELLTDSTQAEYCGKAIYPQGWTDDLGHSYRLAIVRRARQNYQHVCHHQRYYRQEI